MKAIKEKHSKKTGEKEQTKIEQLELFFNCSRDLLMLLGFDSRFKRLNPSFERILGWTLEELLSQLFFEFIHPDDVKRTIQEFEELQKGQKTHRFENRYRCKDGSYKWVSWNLSPLLEKQIFVGTGRDITERKKAEEALKNINRNLVKRLEMRTRQVSEERQRLYSILETLPAYVILLDKEYRTRFANRVFRERFGESNGRRCHEFLFGRGEPCENCETYTVLDTNAPHHWEWIGPDGRKYDVYDFPFPEVGGSSLILEMGIDVTERTLAEKKLRDASLYTRSLIEASLDPLVTISSDGKITDVNKATESVTGFPRERLIGSDFSDYFTEPEEARKGYQKVFTNGFVRDYPLAIRHKSGKITCVLYNATVYSDENGFSQGVFAAARDITELKKAEEKSLESAKKLKDAERLAAIGATAGMVGHDIRNPLQSITGDIYLANSELSSLPDSEQKRNIKESLEEIAKAVDYVNKIVADLQDYARPITPVKQEIRFKELIEDLTLKYGIPKNIEIRVEIHKRAEKIKADPALLKRVLDNLIVNSVQAMPNGGKLTVRTRRTKPGITINVHDTGVGIPEEIRGKMFTPLFTTKSKGQGFGLAVVKRLTETMGGTVAFKSEAGKGTSFVLFFPALTKHEE